MSYFTNSGSEANELAMLMAREFTGRSEIISLRNAYHGGTQGTMALTAVGTWKFPSNPPSAVKNATPGYCYRCPFGLTYPSCDVRCARDVEIVDSLRDVGQAGLFHRRADSGRRRRRDAAAGISSRSSTKSSAGMVACASPTKCKPALAARATHFWGFENWGVTPDLVTMAKGIGNGVPLGACVTRAEIAQTMSNRIHFNTFGGNPISMTQGLATLEVIDRENIQENARVVGGHLKDRLLDLQERQPLIGEVRGMGLMLGVELVRDRETKEPATTEAADVLEHCKERGLLSAKGGCTATCCASSRRCA